MFSLRDLLLVVLQLSSSCLQKLPDNKLLERNEGVFQLGQQGLVVKHIQFNTDNITEYMKFNIIKEFLFDFKDNYLSSIMNVMDDSLIWPKGLKPNILDNLRNGVPVKLKGSLRFKSGLIEPYPFPIDTNAFKPKILTIDFSDVQLSGEKGYTFFTGESVVNLKRSLMLYGESPLVDFDAVSLVEIEGGENLLYKSSYSIESLPFNIGTTEMLRNCMLIQRSLSFPKQGSPFEKLVLDAYNIVFNDKGINRSGEYLLMEFKLVDNHWNVFVHNQSTASKGIGFVDDSDIPCYKGLVSTFTKMGIASFYIFPYSFRDKGVGSFLKGMFGGKKKVPECVNRCQVAYY